MVRSWQLIGSVALAIMAGSGCIAQPGPRHTLYLYKGPDWSWQPKVETPQLASQPTPRRIRLTAPLAALGPLAPNWRVGLVSGQPGTAPATWLRPGTSFRAAGSPGPLSGLAVGGAQVASASVRAAGADLQVDLAFSEEPDFGSAWDLYLLIDTDGDPATGFLGGDALLQDVTLGPGRQAGLQVPWLELAPGLVRPGKPLTVTAWVLNSTRLAISNLSVALHLPAGVRCSGPLLRRCRSLHTGEALRLEWRISAPSAGCLPIRLTARGSGQSARARQWLTVTANPDPRIHYVTSSGAWVAMPPRPTLQRANRAPLLPLAIRPSSANKRNLFGITAHLPRSVDGEDPFAARHAIDGDPATCWASRWWRVPVPLTPEAITIDLGCVRRVASLRYLPAWRNSGAPAGCRVETSLDGRAWHSAASNSDIHVESGETPSWRRIRFAPTSARFVRLAVFRLRQGGTSFFCAPFEPFQLRIAEIRAADAAGRVFRPTAAHVTSVFHAWYNDPATIKATWPTLLASGVKLNRIGQWGDKTDWATVEQRKGVLAVDPEVDRAITQSKQAGVETLLTLDYGNNLYEKIAAPPDFGPTWHRSHPFLQCAPTTPEAIAGFARYCGFMARHFRGRIRYYEIWNEENGWFFNDWAANSKVSMARAFGKALRAAAEAVKRADPKATVVFGGTAGMAPDFVRVALDEADAGRFIDVVAFHPYGHPTAEAAADNFLTQVGDQFEWRPRPAAQKTYELEMSALKRMVREYNPRMQVWADEMNWFAPGQPAMTGMGDQSELQQAKHLARFYALNSWLEIGAIWWSLYNANGIQEWAILRSADGSPRPAYRAAGALATVLDDVRPMAAAGIHAVGRAPTDLMLKVYRAGSGERIVVLWRTSPPSDTCRPVALDLGLPSGVTDWEIVDPVYGARQPAVTARTGARQVIRGLMVGDWPLFVRTVRRDGEPAAAPAGVARRPLPR